MRRKRIGEPCFLNIFPSDTKLRDGFLVDANGSISEQIDIVVFDRQYSPFLFNQDGCKYMPAESVYAVFEVKPDP